MERRRLAMWLPGVLLGLALLLPGRASWAQCFECYCNNTGTSTVGCTSDSALATAYCTASNTTCSGFGQISTTACTSLPFQNCGFIIAPPKAPAPTLGSWQLALVAVLLAGTGWFLVRRRPTDLRK